MISRAHHGHQGDRAQCKNIWQPTLHKNSKVYFSNTVVFLMVSTIRHDAHCHLRQYGRKPKLKILPALLYRPPREKGRHLLIMCLKCTNNEQKATGPVHRLELFCCVGSYHLQRVVPVLKVYGDGRVDGVRVFTRPAGAADVHRDVGGRQFRQPQQRSLLATPE